MPWRLPPPVTLLVTGFAIGACSAGGAAPSPASGDGGEAIPFPPTGCSTTVCVAETINFEGFCNWPSATAVASVPDASDGVHEAGPLKVFWNRSPPPGSHEFPVGTMILKESQESDPSKRVVFAMVKRQASGTGFNSTGADGWEWWSVQDLGNCSIERLWRGTTPPTNESYTNTPGGDCNTCHGQVVDNDHVWDEALELSKF
jgi:hypothetical protein